jgi:dTDP-4-dehydrorhamnose 3,5-epimerase
MHAEKTALDGVVVITFDFHEDDRGWFVETYDSVEFRDLGLPDRWAHDSWSLSRFAGTVRGLHFQAPPSAQAKLVRVPHGRVFDVAVDLRSSSPSHGAHISLELDRTQALYVPVGFAHGFCTLEPNTEVAYKMSTPYAADLARGLAWDDPDLNIPWPELASRKTVSDRDTSHPRLRDLPPSF